MHNANLFIRLNVARKYQTKKNSHSNKTFLFCRHFPNCMYGTECLYIHPPCRFGGACTRSDCLYTHSSATPASSPNDNAATGRAPTTRPESSTVREKNVFHVHTFDLSFSFSSCANSVYNVCVRIACIHILVCHFPQLETTNGLIINGESLISNNISFLLVLSG